MRYLDFKLLPETRMYTEADSKSANRAVNSGLESQHTLHDIQAIKVAIPNIPIEKANEKMKLLDQVKKLNIAVEKFIQKVAGKQPVQTQVQQQPAPQADPARQTNDPNATVEADANPDVQKKLYNLKDYERADAELEAELNKYLENIKFLETIEMDDADRQRALSMFNENLDQLTKNFETIRDQRDSARAERDEAVTFVKEVTGILTVLGNKVQGYEPITPDDLAAMSSKDRSLYKKSATNAEAFTKTLKQALFGKILDMQEGSDVTQEEIKNFLQACADGKVIDMLSVVKQSKGNVKNHVNAQYQKIFDVFVKENIFSYSPGTTSGAIGPGEMALSMMGNPAEKGKKGDLKVGDQEVEIKASKATGGRLNSKAIAKATTGWQVWSENIAEILSSAPKDRTIGVPDKKGQIKQVPISKWNGNQFNYNAKNKRAKEASKYNWNQKGFDGLNAEVLQPYSNFDKTYKLFHDTIKALVQNLDKIENWDKWLANSIEPDGTVDYIKLNKAYTRIAYQSYHLADGITTVMLLRTDTLDFIIIRDGAELADRLGDDIAMGAGFNWNDDQQTPTPGYLPAK